MYRFSKTFFLLISLSFYQLAFSQISPWGTGTINNVFVDTLAKNKVLTSHTFDIVNFQFDLNNYLFSYNFNIYIPSTYDGTKPYGLVTFINSGNIGSIFNPWIPVLEEKNLIMISGNNIGNSIPVVTRIGVALAGAEKMKEILNIDTTRVYASGNSGGGRSAADLLYFFPEYFNGMVPNCGAMYLRQVAQDYETHQLNSHYEYGFQYNQVHLDYVKSFDRRFAIMTAFDDFREGDIMNIYHNGMEQDGFKSKFLETAGGHCSSTAEHFIDAINFVEHPHHLVVQDSFNLKPIGFGFKTEGSKIIKNELVLFLDSNNIAQAFSNNPFLWNDDKGAIIRTSIRLDSTKTNNNSFLNIGFTDFSNPTIYNQKIGVELLPQQPNFILSLVFQDSLPKIYFLCESPSSNISNDTLYSGSFVDWDFSQPLPLKFHLWNQELRLEMGHHLISDTITNPMVKLLDDSRSVRIRTDGNYWDSTAFSSGALLTYTAGRIDTSAKASNIFVNYIEVIAAESLNCDIIGRIGLDKITACDDFTWLDGIKYTKNNNSASYLIKGGGINGCDSLVYLDLQILESTFSTDTQKACGSYTWINGKTYDFSINSEKYSIQNQKGCDSIITLDLTLHKVDTSISKNWPIFVSNASNANYQWINCIDNTPLIGATFQTFIPQTNGVYAVIVTEKECTDTSACFTVIGIGENELNLKNNLTLYPNPSNGNFNLKSTYKLDKIQITITDLSGKMIENKVVTNAQNIELNLNAPNGIYWLQIETETMYQNFKLVKIASDN